MAFGSSGSGGGAYERLGSDSPGPGDIGGSPEFLSHQPQAQCLLISSSSFRALNLVSLLSWRFYGFCLLSFDSCWILQLSNGPLSVSLSTAHYIGL